MKRPVIIWSTFALLAVAGCAVLGWFTAQVLRLERESAETRRLAAVEENVRLALWRLDSALAVIQGAEAARSPEEYQPFLPATGMPSPLLGHAPRFVLLHLEIMPDGTVRSPQVPAGAQRTRAIAAGASAAEIDAAADRFDHLLAQLDPKTIPRMLARNQPAFDLDTRKEELAANDAFAPVRTARSPGFSEADLASPQDRDRGSLAKSQAELLRREELFEQQALLNVAEAERRRSTAPASSSLLPANAGRTAAAKMAAPEPASAPASGDFAMADERQERSDSPAWASAADESTRKVTAAAPAPGLKSKDGIAPEGGTGLLRPLWVGSELFLARNAVIGNEPRTQAVWLDWPELSAWMAGRIADLLPDARLVPQPDVAAPRPEDSRRLAFLPVAIEPGFVPVPAQPASPLLRLGLAAAWAGAALALGALGLLLHGTLRLSERRGAFVSAVTHELRTPLTTFRMYTEMLAGGMVPDEGKRHTYLETLRLEAERLSHLVENVLSYARLERGRASSRIETTTATALADAIGPRLRQRAEQAGMTLRLEVRPEIGDTTVRIDRTAAEQIVFNLVDNAAKYARRPDRDGTIAVSIDKGRRPGQLTIRVTDNGPGLPATMKRRLFRPFSRSAAEAAGSQPGVGLGLALCRRLARQELRGNLVLERSDNTGTVFRLEIRST